MSNFRFTLVHLTAVGLATCVIASCTTDDRWSSGRDRGDMPHTDRYVYEDGRYEQGRSSSPGRQASSIAGDSDAFFMMEAAHINAAEIELSRIAMNRSNDSDVREFAQQMIDDHTQLQQQVQQLARQMDVSIPNRRQQARTLHQDHLRSLSGREFDEAYLNMMIADHARAVTIFDNKLRQATDSNVRNLADNALPVLRQHYDRAVSLSNRLAEGSTMQD